MTNVLIKCTLADNGFLNVFGRATVKDEFVRLGEVRVGGIEQRIRQLHADKFVK